MTQEQTETGGNAHDTTAPESSAKKRAARAEHSPLADLRLPKDLAALDERLRATVQERPFIALGAAVLAGYLLGRALSRL